MKFCIAFKKYGEIRKSESNNWIKRSEPHDEILEITKLIKKNKRIHKS